MLCNNLTTLALVRPVIKGRETLLSDIVVLGLFNGRLCFTKRNCTSDMTKVFLFSQASGPERVAEKPICGYSSADR